jgi:SAM-dependent methyltransferase
MMSNKKKSTGTSRSSDQLYNAAYYQNYDGGSYNHEKKWVTFFGNIADNIVEKLQPDTAIDVGCAYGILVESLRDRGVKAHGLDVSAFAVGQSRDDIRPFLSTGSILDPIAQKYDLLVCIEVIEHIKEADCLTAIKNMCSASDAVLIASTPDDFDDPTHFNVQPPEYWITQFSKFGYKPDIQFDANFITPYAILFRKTREKTSIELGRLFGKKKLLDYQQAGLVHERNLLPMSILSQNNNS